MKTILSLCGNGWTTFNHTIKSYRENWTSFDTLDCIELGTFSIKTALYLHQDKETQNINQLMHVSIHKWMRNGYKYLRKLQLPNPAMYFCPSPPSKWMFLQTSQWWRAVCFHCYVEVIQWGYIHPSWMVMWERQVASGTSLFEETSLSGEMLLTENRMKLYSRESVQLSAVLKCRSPFEGQEKVGNRRASRLRKLPTTPLFHRLILETTVCYGYYARHMPMII
jgi:hypothetical protein